MGKPFTDFDPHKTNELEALREAHERLLNDNALKERAIVELEDWKENLLRQRTALLEAAKLTVESTSPHITAHQKAKEAIALAEGDQDGAS